MIIFGFRAKKNYRTIDLPRMRQRRRRRKEEKEEDEGEKDQEEEEERKTGRMGGREEEGKDFGLLASERYNHS